MVLEPQLCSSNRILASQNGICSGLGRQNGEFGYVPHMTTREAFDVFMEGRRNG